MAIRLPGPSDLYLALRAEDFELPEECGDIELLMPVDGLLQLKFTVNVYGEQLGKLGRALERLATGNIPEFLAAQRAIDMIEAAKGQK